MSYSYFVIKDFPIAYYKMDSTGDTLEDSSGFGNDGQFWNLIDYAYSEFTVEAGQLVEDMKAEDNYAIIELEGEEISPGFIEIDGEIMEVIE